MSSSSRLQTSENTRSGETPRAWPKRVRTSGFDSSGIHCCADIVTRQRVGVSGKVAMEGSVDLLR